MQMSQAAQLISFVGFFLSKEGEGGVCPSVCPNLN